MRRDRLSRPLAVRRAIDVDGAANFVSLNTADNWLHLLLAVGMAGTGLALAHAPRRQPLATTQR